MIPALNRSDTFMPSSFNVAAVVGVALMLSKYCINDRSPAKILSIHRIFLGFQGAFGGCYTHQ